MGLIKPKKSGIDTSDATAGEKNIEDGYTAYVNGKKVQGTLIRTNASKYGTQIIYTDYIYGDVVICEATNTRKIIHPENSKISTMTPFTEFGNATAADVAKGKTFTSTAGLKVTGTYEPETGGGIDTSDATATAADIVKDKTAYVNGEKLTGEYIPLDTSDATATAADIMEDKIAYVNGVKITGTKSHEFAFSQKVTIDEMSAAIDITIPSDLKSGYYFVLVRATSEDNIADSIYDCYGFYIIRKRADGTFEMLYYISQEPYNIDIDGSTLTLSRTQYFAPLTTEVIMIYNGGL